MVFLGGVEVVIDFDSSAVEGSVGDDIARVEKSLEFGAELFEGVDGDHAAGADTEVSDGLSAAEEEFGEDGEL